MNLLCLGLVSMAVVGCSGSSKEPTEEAVKVTKQAKELQKKAKDCKPLGNNDEALKLFSQARDVLEPVFGKQSVEYAASIDHMATVHMRTGNYKDARKLYKQAIEILAKAEPRDDRLLSSTMRRVATLDALEAQKITCAEPQIAPADPSPLPYAPEFKDVEPALGKMNARLSSCIKGGKRTVTTWLVISGDGRFIRAEVRTKMAGSPQAKCIEKRAVELSSELGPLLPRFNACFKNYNYPFRLGN